jgi:hypothetical protein
MSRNKRKRSADRYRLDAQEISPRPHHQSCPTMPSSKGGIYKQLNQKETVWLRKRSGKNGKVRESPKEKAE